MAETLNYFKPVTTGQDNPLILDGTVETSNGSNLKKTFINVELADISTASSCYVVAPAGGTISKIYSVINGAITGANSIVTSNINGVAITNGSITVAFSGSAAGHIDSATPTALNTVVAGDLITLTTDGGSTNTVKTVFTIEITLA
jgi:hypothetical protein